MTNEIKEDDILCLIECLKSHKINFDYCLNELLDYITNLQEKYEEADNDRHELFERNNKAIEYIEENTTKEYEVPLIDSFSISYQKLVNILRGDE